jgi:hypothetical protein
MKSIPGCCHSHELVSSPSAFRTPRVIGRALRKPRSVWRVHIANPFAALTRALTGAGPEVNPGPLPDAGSPPLQRGTYIALGFGRDGGLYRPAAPSHRDGAWPGAAQRPSVVWCCGRSVEYGTGRRRVLTFLVIWPLESLRREPEPFWGLLAGAPRHAVGSAGIASRRHLPQ